MAENRESPAAGTADSVSVPEDDRRAKAAEVNRKRTEELWERNKKRWLRTNFPDLEQKKKGSPAK
jgi:hypothetical protein